MDAIQGCCYSPCRPREPSQDETKTTTRVALRDDTALTVKLAAAGESSEAGSESGTVALNYKRSEKTSIMIRTQDGDVVRLRIARRESAELKAGTSEDGEQQLTELEFRTRSSLKLGVFIKGELDADELGAIRSVVEQAGGLAREFFAGGSAEAFAAASKLEIDGQQLAKVALRLRVREQFGYAQSGSMLPLPGLVPAAGASKQGGAAAEPAATTIEAAARFDARVRIATSVGAVGGSNSVAAPPPVADSEPAAEPAPAAVGETAETAETETQAPVATEESPESPAGDSPSAIDSGNPFALLGSILGFLTRLIEAFEPGARPAGDGADKADAEESEESAPAASLDSVQFSLKMRIFSSVVANFAVAAMQEADEATDATSTAAVATLTDAVETIAAESDPGLDAVA